MTRPEPSRSCVSAPHIWVGETHGRAEGVFVHSFVRVWPPDLGGIHARNVSRSASGSSARRPGRERPSVPLMATPTDTIFTPQSRPGSRRTHRDRAHRRSERPAGSRTSDRTAWAPASRRLDPRRCDAVDVPRGCVHLATSANTTRSRVDHERARDATLVGVTSRHRTSNTRIAAYIAGVTVVLTVIVILLVPPIADRFTAPTKAQSAEGGWMGAPGLQAPRAVVIGQAEAVAAVPAVPPAPAAPALPAPGEQPPDVTGAREAVRIALETVFSGDNPREVRLSAVDDPSNLDAAMAKAREAYTEASTTSEAEIGEIVFTDPTHASFLFRLRYTGAPLLASRLGSAVLVGDRWFITRSTLCEVLAQAGATCPASTQGG